MMRFILVFVSLTVAGLFYVYEEVEAVKTGYVIRKQEEEKTLLLDRARALKYNIARLEAPHNLEKKLLAQRIVLGPPKSWQTLMLPGTGKSQAPVTAGSPNGRPLFFTRFFVGTAQAEAKEASGL